MNGVNAAQREQIYEYMHTNEDYRSKYGPMLQLLNADADLRFIRETARPHERKAILQDFETHRRQAIKNYLTDLFKDYDQLYQTAAIEALRNPDLAQYVAGLDKTFRQSIRAIRARLFFELLFPSKTVQRFLLAAFSRLAADQLVLSMELMRGKLT